MVQMTWPNHGLDAGLPGDAVGTRSAGSWRCLRSVIGDDFGRTVVRFPPDPLIAEGGGGSPKPLPTKNETRDFRWRKKTFGTPLQRPRRARFGWPAAAG